MSTLTVTRQILEAMMETDEWKDDFIESYVKIGVDQGRQEGREEGREEGAAETKAQDVLKALDVRGLKPTKKQRAKVTADAGLATLSLWFDRALTAATADDVFKGDES